MMSNIGDGPFSQVVSLEMIVTESFVILILVLEKQQVAVGLALHLVYGLSRPIIEAACYYQMQQWMVLFKGAFHICFSLL